MYKVDTTVDSREGNIMKQLSSIMILSIDGGKRISYTYNELNKFGDVMVANVKRSFFAIDEELRKN